MVHSEQVYDCFLISISFWPCSDHAENMMREFPEGFGKSKMLNKHGKIELLPLRKMATPD